MISPIVHGTEAILLIGGADLPPKALERGELFTNRCIAADGGAASLIRAGRIPEAVIGDMDSVPNTLLEGLAPGSVHRIDEQDSTDFEKCLMRLQAPLILGLGFLGGRLDHQLAAFHALLRFARQPCILLGQDEVVFLCPPRLEVPLAAGTAVSLFPLAPVCASARGLEWSFDQLDLASGGRIGTSNVARGRISLQVDAPGLLCILPEHCFEVAVTALLAQPGSWSARA